MLKLLLVGLCAGALAACSHPVREARDFCLQNGFQPGTELYLQCMQTQETANEVRDEETSNALFRLSHALHQASVQSAHY